MVFIQDGFVDWIRAETSGCLSNTVSLPGPDWHLDLEKPVKLNRFHKWSSLFSKILKEPSFAWMFQCLDDRTLANDSQAGLLELCFKTGNCAVLGTSMKNFRVLRKNTSFTSIRVEAPKQLNNREDWTTTQAEGSQLEDIPSTLSKSCFPEKFFWYFHQNLEILWVTWHTKHKRLFTQTPATAHSERK